MSSSQEPTQSINGMDRLLGRLFIVPDHIQYRQLLERLTRPDRPRIVSFLNQHAFNLSWRDPAFCEALWRSDVLLRDGVGMAACLRLLGRRPGLNMNGTDLIPGLAKAYRGRSIAVIGTLKPYTQRAAQRLRDEGLDVVYTAEGFADASDYLPALRAASPDLIVLGMGMPKQELIAQQLTEALDYPTLIVNGGAILDFLAERFPRAPRWLQRMRLEWLYRLALEPRRLWRRYLLGGAYFIARALRLALAPGQHENHAAPHIPGAIMENTSWPARPPTTLAAPVISPTGSSMASLVQRVDACLNGSFPRIVQFTAARAGEGVSSVAHSYAQATAMQHGHKVLLLSNDLGTGETLPCLGDDDLATTPQTAGISYARLFDTKQEHPENLRLLADASTWAALRASFDEVVIDAKSAFAATLASRSDGILVVVEAEATPAAALRTLLDQLAAAHARVLGTVLNKRRDYLPRFLHDRL